eukprot:SAG31_NODE_2156_length_6309_cov_30.741707_1_plen_179_part_00
MARNERRTRSSTERDPKFTRSGRISKPTAKAAQQAAPQQRTKHAAAPQQRTEAKPRKKASRPRSAQPAVSCDEQQFVEAGMPGKISAFGKKPCDSSYYCTWCEGSGVELQRPPELRLIIPDYFCGRPTRHWAVHHPTKSSFATCWDEHLRRYHPEILISPLECSSNRASKRLRLSGGT